MHKLKQTLQGQVLLRGKNLVLNGRNLEQAFDRFESSQTFNPDVGEHPQGTGPVVKLLKQVGSLFPGGACEVFYAGSVVPPK